MGDGDDGLAGHQAVERILDRRLDLRIERRGRLVEHQDGRVLQEDARDGDALALAAGQLDAALADMGVIAGAPLRIDEAADELVGMGELRRLLDLRVGRLRPAVGDVVVHRTMQQRGILRDHADLLAERFLRHVRRCPARR